MRPASDAKVDTNPCDFACPSPSASFPAVDLVFKLIGIILFTCFFSWSMAKKLIVSAFAWFFMSSGRSCRCIAAAAAPAAAVFSADDVSRRPFLTLCSGCFCSAGLSDLRLTRLGEGVRLVLRLRDRRDWFLKGRLPRGKRFCRLRPPRRMSLITGPAYGLRDREPDRLLFDRLPDLRLRERECDRDRDLKRLRDLAGESEAGI